MTAAGKQPTGTALRDSRDERIELVIGRLLQFGVLAAAIVVLAGGILLLAQYGHLPANSAAIAAQSYSWDWCFSSRHR
jgi:uncharacterized membrane protein